MSCWCLAKRSASGSLRLFTCLSPEMNTDHPTSVLGCKTEIDNSSLTWTASSHVMQESSKNCQNFQRQMFFGANYTNSFEQNRKEIWVYRAMVLAILYSSETWVTYLSHMHIKHCHSTILNIHWSGFITNMKIQEEADISRIKSMLLMYHL